MRPRVRPWAGGCSGRCVIAGVVSETVDTQLKIIRYAIISPALLVFLGVMRLPVSVRAPCFMVLAL